MTEHDETQRMTEDDDERGRPGAEGEGSKDTPPPLPDPGGESPLGDTDQHSDADA